MGRLKIVKDTNVTVCILDSGVNNGHPLLAPVLEDKKCQTVKLEWGVNDGVGHGTQMAVLITYGDLQKSLETKTGLIQIL